MREDGVGRKFGFRPELRILTLIIHRLPNVDLTHGKHFKAGIPISTGGGIVDLSFR